MRMRSGSHGARGVAGFAHIARVGALLTLSLVALAATAVNFAPVAHADSFSLDILVPKPQSNIAEGPVGTNVTLSGQGATAGHTYQLSYASNKLGCTVGGPLGSAPAGADGKFTTTIAWPDAASSVGATYVICYKDTDAGPSLGQPSDQSFRVDAGSPPSITLAPPPSSTPDADNSPSTYPAGGAIQISGKNFYSNHVQLLAFATLNQNFAPSDLQAGAALKRVDTGNAGFNADANGSFSVQVKLPSFTGSFFLHVVSNDGGGKYLPALIDTQAITIGQAPTPTATVGPTATPTVGATPTPPGGGSDGSVNASGLVGVLSLGGLSILLFILGVYLLTSTGATPRNL